MLHQGYQSLGQRYRVSSSPYLLSMKMIPLVDQAIFCAYVVITLSKRKALNYKRCITDAIALVKKWTPFNGLSLLYRDARDSQGLCDWNWRWCENLFINWTFAIIDLFQFSHRISDFVRRNPNRSPHGRIFHLNPNVDCRYLPPPKLLREHFRQDTKGKGARVLASQRRPGGEYWVSGRWY